MVKAAPTFDSADDITDESETRIREYFATPISDETFNERYVDEPRRTAKAKPSDEASMRLKAEELHVGKREVEYGGARLRKIVRTETINQPVELQREDIVVERVPVQGDALRTGTEEFSDEEIYIPLRREEAVVEKTERATEEIRVGKRHETAREQVQATVRREDVEIEKQGGANPKTRSDWREGGSTPGRSS